MLPHVHRGLNRKLVEKILRTGKQTSNRFFKAWIVRKKEGSAAFAVMLSSKVFKTAVERNALRRKIHEILRRNYVAHSEPLNIVISVKASCQKADFDTLKTELLDLLTLYS